VAISVVGRDDGEAGGTEHPNGIKMPIPPDASEGYIGRRSIVAMDDVVRFGTACPDGLARTGSERTIDILRDRLLIRMTPRLP